MHRQVSGCQYFNAMEDESFTGTPTATRNPTPIDGDGNSYRGVHLRAPCLPVAVLVGLNFVGIGWQCRPMGRMQNAGHKDLSGLWHLRFEVLWFRTGQASNLRLKVSSPGDQAKEPPF